MMHAFNKHTVHPRKKCGMGNTGLGQKRAQQEVCDQVMAEVLKPKPQKGKKQ